MSSELAVLQPSDMDTLKQTLCRGASDADMQMFGQVCQRTGLDPFTRQIYWIPGKGAIISIDGQRVLSERSGKYEGMTAAEWCGGDGKWRDVWLDPRNPPAACRVGVYRAGAREPITAIATWQGYAQSSPQWQKNGPNMLAKCAESLARRKAFPQELSGLYTREEMGEEPNDEPPGYESLDWREVPVSGGPKLSEKDKAEIAATKALLAERDAADIASEDALAPPPLPPGTVLKTIETYPAGELAPPIPVAQLGTPKLIDWTKQAKLVESLLGKRWEFYLRGEGDATSKFVRWDAALATPKGDVGITLMYGSPSKAAERSGGKDPAKLIGKITATVDSQSKDNPGAFWISGLEFVEVQDA